MKEIKIEILESAFRRIIEKLRFENVGSVAIDSDFYSIIPTDKWNLQSDVEDIIELGSLYDDIDSVEQLVNDESRPCTYVDFDRVASILRIISQIQNPP